MRPRPTFVCALLVTSVLATAAGAGEPQPGPPIFPLPPSGEKADESAPTTGVTVPLPGASVPNWPAITNPGGPRNAGFEAGASIDILRPYFNGNTAFTRTTGIGTNSPSQQSESFDWNFQPAFDVWLGWTSCNGLGVRAHYFNFDESSRSLNTTLGATAAATSAIAPPAGLGDLPGGNFGAPGIVLGAGLGQSNLRFDSSLQLSALDLEATWSCKCGGLSMLLSGGGRYLHLAQAYNASLSNQTTAAGLTIRETQLLHYDHNFNGGGPTVSWYGRYELGRSGVALFGSVRGSLLVGSGQEHTLFSQQVLDPTGLAGGNQTLSPSRSNRFDHVLPVLEAELGLEYGFNLSHSRIFLRGSAVTQTYFDGGNASSTSGNFGLFGGKVAIGIDF